MNFSNGCSTLLSVLLDGFCDVTSGQDCHITNITLDSREVREGSCFLSINNSRGEATEYAKNAEMAGAVCVVTDSNHVAKGLSIPVVQVPSLFSLLGGIVARYFSFPTRDQTVFAVTGTNGKTTVAHSIAQALTSLGKKCGYIGTLGAGLGEDLIKLDNTTPNIIALNWWMHEFLKKSCFATAVEVSSHALAQRRIAGVDFDVAIFTNLGHDHLDYHQTFGAYAKSKSLLFEDYNIKSAVINVDDAIGSRLASKITDADLWTCSSDPQGARVARVLAKRIDCEHEGVNFDFHAEGQKARIHSNLVGRFNVDNLLCVGGGLLAAGVDFERVMHSIGTVETIPGRMENCGKTNSGASVFVDYAHSPDSLKQVAKTLRALSEGQLIIVFGCGGDRDRTKRRVMGSVAADFFDQIIVTNDNPRSEEPEAIALEILEGAKGHTRVSTILDRRSAIELSIGGATQGDVILIAGKGHETFQEIKGSLKDFSDRAIVSRLLDESL